MHDPNIKLGIKGIGKYLRRVLKLLLVVVLSPIVILVRLLRPVVLIRFGPIRSERIGNFAADPEVYLSECDLGMHGKKAKDIFYYSYPICNQQLKKMWDRILWVCRFARWVDFANRCLPGAEKHVIPFRPYQGHDVYGALKSTRPHLSFSNDEEDTGKNYLRSIGIEEGNSFICFHTRDSAYLESRFPGKDWTYHQYRDSKIEDYLLAAEAMVERGYFMIRMGDRVVSALATKNPRIIDYASQGRTDFLDIYLGSKCRFFLGTSSGLIAVPMVFRKSVACANLISVTGAIYFNHGDLVIPKKLWSKARNRLLTFQEILGSEIKDFGFTSQYKEAEIEVVNNSPEEILALAIELDERIKGAWKETDEDKMLQERFWAIFKQAGLDYQNKPRIGAEFLRHHRALLE